LREKLHLASSVKENYLGFSQWRGSQVVRQGSAKASFVGSIPTLASSLFVGICEENSGKKAKFQ
jgi:hypothetical protein